MWVETCPHVWSPRTSKRPPLSNPNVHVAFSVTTLFLIGEIPKGAELPVRSFLTQSDSASRNRPFSTGFFFDWILLILLLIGSRADFYSFCALPRGGWCERVLLSVRQSKSLCSALLGEQRLDEPSSQRVGGFRVSRKPPKLILGSCTQPRAAKATASEAVVGSIGSIARAAAVV